MPHRLNSLEELLETAEDITAYEDLRSSHGKPEGAREMDREEEPRVAGVRRSKGTTEEEGKMQVFCTDTPKK